MMNKITVKATIAGNITTVWDFYTLPKHITKWNFATDDWHCPTASNNMKVGGKYFARMEAKDGSFAFDFEAIYDEIVVGEKFTFTMSNGRKVTVTFNNLNNNATEVVVCFDPEDENSLELQREGWQAILNNFKNYVEVTSL